MIFNEKEKTMYHLMSAIYAGNIPISFKGSMILKLCLIELNYNDNIRLTQDIDGNWISDNPPTGKQIEESLQAIIDKNDLSLKVVLGRNYGPQTSAGFKFYDSDDHLLFSMDLDVGRPEPSIKLYEINDIKVYGVTLNQIIADKLSVVSSDHIFRRIKDLIDLYYLSSVVDINDYSGSSSIILPGASLGDFSAFNDRIDEIKHAYDKFRLGDEISKPDFYELYDQTSRFIEEIKGSLDIDCEEPDI